MSELTEAKRAAILKKQEEEWPNHVKGGGMGNPFATLCRHCYGRHKPPHNEICPHEPPQRGSH